MKTNHAHARAQQRGIPPFVVRLLDDFGAEEHDGRGGVIRFFDKNARREMERELGRRIVARMSEWLDTYSVRATDGALITIGHRYERIRRGG